MLFEHFLGTKCYMFDQFWKCWRKPNGWNPFSFHTRFLFFSVFQLIVLGLWSLTWLYWFSFNQKRLPFLLKEHLLTPAPFDRNVNSLWRLDPDPDIVFYAAVEWMNVYLAFLLELPLSFISPTSFLLKTAAYGWWTLYETCSAPNGRQAGEHSEAFSS